MSKKPFQMIVQLVRTQIYAEKLLKKHTVEEAQSNLQELMAKYDWIAQASPSIEQGTRPLKPRELVPRIILIDQEGGNKQQSQQQQRQQKIEKPQQPVKAVPKSPKPPQQQVEDLAASDLKSSKFDPSAAQVDPNDSRVPCQYCQRRFDADRVEKHENICSESPTKKAAAEKRKQAVNKSISKRTYNSGNETVSVKKK
ncbi:C2HC-type zinc-finger domain-containing protein [Spironucleus salmonicida]|uniref:C2HC-type zinc-finger domain-containing protein n=1 Tax=Spironucleus salmonicida TaxID=348837 RepID=V6LS35_9EUKA|nr:C2HC-type zinc-finger domain-containing protein [Spironucleus salmonicida]|eukprot:EST47472.1 hypothetical protein SS50377_12458 [Spironucleus salmonicida]